MCPAVTIFSLIVLVNKSRRITLKNKLTHSMLVADSLKFYMKFIYSNKRYP